MITTVCLLGWASTGRARRRVQVDKLERGFLFFGELFLATLRITPDEFAVPTLVTPATEGEAAILAHGKSVLHPSLVLGHISTTCTGLLLWFTARVFFCIMKLETFRLLVLLGFGCTLAPRPRAVNRSLVRFKFCLVLQSYVSLHHLRLKRNLKKFARTDGRLGLPPLLVSGLLGNGSSLFCAARLQAPYRRKVTLLDCVIVKVFQTLGTKHMTTVYHAMALCTLLWIWRIMSANDTSYPRQEGVRLKYRDIDLPRQTPQSNVPFSKATRFASIS